VTVLNFPAGAAVPPKAATAPPSNRTAIHLFVQYSLLSTLSTIRVCGSPIRAGAAARDDHTSRCRKVRKASASLALSNSRSITT
jgi:hypothetical protein